MAFSDGLLTLIEWLIEWAITSNLSSIMSNIIQGSSMKKLIAICALMLASALCHADLTYGHIAKNNPTVALTKEKVAELKMQGQCLVALKELNFKKKNEFDAVSEWTSFRTASLLEEYSPCETLIILEVAREELLKQKK